MLGSKFVKFLMSILKRQVNSFSNFASFFIAMTHNSSANYKLLHFLLWIRRSYQSPNFETFECSGKNLPNSLCFTFKMFLQISHHSLMSWNITSLYFFGSNIIYFVRKEPIKVQTFETFEGLSQNSSNSSCQFETTSQFLFKVYIIFHCHDT